MKTRLLWILSILALATTSNEFLIEHLFSPDGHLGDTARGWIRTGNALLLIGLFSVLWFRRAIGRVLIEAFQHAPNLMASCLGLILLFSILVMVELGFHSYNVIHARHHPSPVKTYVPSLWGGQWPVVSHSRSTLGDRVVFDVTYTVDEKGSRVTPATTKESTGRDLVFFGCSFTFGEGLEDDETIPNQVAKRAPGWRVTNLAYPGQGPGHILARIEKPETINLFRGNEVKGVYVYIPSHIERVIGSMRITTTWARDFPYYDLSPMGEVEYRGTMRSGRPVLSRLYWWLSKEPILRYFDVDVPEPLTDRHIELTTRVVQEFRDRWIAGLDKTSFTVVIFPTPVRARVPASRFIPHLESKHIPYLDYSGRFNEMDIAQVWIPEDHHPTAKAARLVAGWLAEDLGLQDVE